MSEEQSNFKVTDRRLFNADGSPRELSAEELAQAKPETKPETRPDTKPETKAETKPAASETASATSPATERPAATASQTASVPDDSQPDTLEDIEIPGAEDPASFANFLMSIASNAASSLGMMEHPVTRKREVDLELGKHWIDVLGMLQDKTRNNLSPQEKQILEGLLADLRMQYVSLANASTPKTPRAFSSGDITGGQ